MLHYVLKRLLLIPPTFFLVSLVIFVVLNIAPGRPGEVGQIGQAESSSSQIQQESYRIFKEQFNLDKPILFNPLPWQKTSRVRQMIAAAHNLDSRTPIKQRILAQERLDDEGNYLVRHLNVLLDDPDPVVARLAAFHLRQAAQRRLHSGTDSPSQRAQNRAIARTNAELKTLYWHEGADEQSIMRVKSAWKTFWHQERDYFEYTTGEALTRFFLDTRFAKYWSNLARFDFGLSTVDRRAVLPVIVSKMRYSLSLTLISVVLAYAIAVPLGVFSAVRQHTLADHVLTLLLFVLYSLPTFFTATVALRLLSEGEPLAWFPTGGFESMESARHTTLERLVDIAWHLVLPVATYTSVSLAALSRYARAGLIDVINADYIRTARAKGLSEWVVIIKHAARNGMIPILTLLGSLLPMLVSGSVVIEVVFDIPGMGLYLYDAINLRDYNAVMGVLIMASLLTLFGILVSDVSYALADPRISFEGR